MKSQFFVKTNANNFVPVTRTPWAGDLIPKIKSRLSLPTPEKIGESWEISTDLQFPSTLPYLGSQSLLAYLESDPISHLGRPMVDRFGAHCPLLLKWIHAAAALSVQIHPNNASQLLKPSECGKPESWLVLSVAPGARLSLGFKDGVHLEDVTAALRNNTLENCLFTYEPQVMDLITIPTGFVHAIGPGILVAEPQLVMPKKAGKTYRFYDWGRTYNDAGETSPQGKPRELHIQESMATIDWSLPQGDAIPKTLIQNLKNAPLFSGNARDPFAVQVCSLEGNHAYTPIFPGQFSLVTCWEGCAQFALPHGDVTLCAGESAFVSASAGSLAFTLRCTDTQNVGLAFFALNLESLDAMG